jgi:putative membrane protein
VVLRRGVVAGCIVKPTPTVKTGKRFEKAPLGAFFVCARRRRPVRVALCGCGRLVILSITIRALCPGGAASTGAAAPARQTPTAAERAFMKFIVWLIRVLVFVVLLVLALANTDSVPLTFAGYVWRAPLILIGLAFFAVGLLAGLVSALPAVVRLKLENARLRRDLRAAREETPAAVVQPPMPPII